MRMAEAIELDEKTSSELLTLSRGRRVEARVQQRASVILLAAQGWQNKDIADQVKLDRRQVALWRRRFIEGGLEVLLQDAPRSGRTPSVTPPRRERTRACPPATSPRRAAVPGCKLTLGSGSSASSTLARRVMLPVCQCSSWRPVMSTSG